MEKLSLDDVVRIDGGKIAAQALVPVPLEDGRSKAVAAEVHRAASTSQNNFCRPAHFALIPIQPSALIDESCTIRNLAWSNPLDHVRRLATD
jgi:hypothetical protein